MTPLHILCNSDGNYAPHCGAMLHSALRNTGGLPAAVHYMHEPSLRADLLEKIKAVVLEGGATFDPIPVPDSAVEGVPTGSFPRSAWYRAVISVMRPGLERALYLDCDTIVLRSLRPLWEMPLDGCFVAAVHNVIEPRFATHPQAVGVPAGQPYFNAGVLLLNLDLMRQHDCARRILDHARQHGDRLIWPDQDSLNYVLGSRCRLLHPRWNCQNTLFYWAEARRVFGDATVDEATQQPAILHFEGPGFAKPWHYLNTHPHRAEYWCHARATPFEVRVQGRTARNMWLRHSAPIRGLLQRTGQLARRAGGWIRRQGATLLHRTR